MPQGGVQGRVHRGADRQNGWGLLGIAAVVRYKLIEPIVISSDPDFLATTRATAAAARLRMAGCCLAGLLVVGGCLAAAPPPDTYGLWERFYALESKDDQAAEAILREILAATPDDVRALKSMLYLQLRIGAQAQALGVADQVLAQAPGDETVQLQRAYLLNGLGRNAEAYAAFSQLAQSHDAKVAATAAQAASNLRADAAPTAKLLPAPYFADFYASPSYESRSRAAILPLKVRVGRLYGADQRGQLYGFATLNRDNRSTGGLRPDIVDENALIAGVGINYRLATAPLPVTAYVELGVSRDLIDRNRAKTRESVVAGLASYQEWGDTALACDAGCPARSRWHADFYGHVATYSRDDYNVIADLRLRPGLNLQRGKQGLLRGYLKLGSSHDTDGAFYNNTFAVGPGLAWHLPADVPLVLRLESLKVFYTRGRAADGRASYHNRRLELTYYRSF